MNTQVSQRGYNGEFSDPVLHQYILGNGYRAYNPALQRFTAPDSMSPFGAGGINPYLYCEGDPVNRTDPTGHIFWEILLATGMMVTDFTGDAGAVTVAGDITGDLLAANESSGDAIPARNAVRSSTGPRQMGPGRSILRPSKSSNWYSRFWSYILNTTGLIQEDSEPQQLRNIRHVTFDPDLPPERPARFLSAVENFPYHNKGKIKRSSGWNDELETHCISIKCNVQKEIEPGRIHASRNPLSAAIKADSASGIEWMIYDPDKGNYHLVNPEGRILYIFTNVNRTDRFYTLYRIAE